MTSNSAAPHRSTSPAKWIGIVTWAVATLSFPFAITLSMMTTSKFVVAKNEFSMLSSLADLWNANEYPLAVLIAFFCICLPVAKYVLLGRFWISRNQSASATPLRWLNKVGKWSMIEVYMCAVLFVFLKLGFAVHVTLHNGLYVFCASVLSGMISTECACRYAQTIDANQSGS